MNARSHTDTLATAACSTLSAASSALLWRKLNFLDEDATTTWLAKNRRLYRVPLESALMLPCLLPFDLDFPQTLCLTPASPLVILSFGPLKRDRQIAGAFRGVCGGHKNVRGRHCLVRAFVLQWQHHHAGHQVSRAYTLPCFSLPVFFFGSCQFPPCLAACGAKLEKIRALRHTTCTQTHCSSALTCFLFLTSAFASTVRTAALLSVLPAADPSSPLCT